MIEKYIDSNMLSKRHKKEKIFQFICKSCLYAAILFLILFFADLIYKGYSAFLQTYVFTEINYSEEAKEVPFLAVSEEMERIVSRGILRLIPRQMEENPALIGTRVKKWVLADAEVDQYLKGKPNRLKNKEKKIVDQLKGEGKIQLKFNKEFFLNGDSKLPEMAGIFSAFMGTLYVLFITLIISFPLGVMAAVYLEEFAPDNRFTQLIEININNLAAIPSILFGLLGLAIFINFMHIPRSSALVGGMTLALMSLPVIIISTRAALRSIPDSIREAAYGLGASKWQMVWYQILPAALPGILTGTIISMARAIGETAPLLIIGMMAYIPDTPKSIFQAATVLPAQIYTWASDSLRAYEERTAAAILVLLASLLLLNGLAIYYRNKYEKKW